MSDAYTKTAPYPVDVLDAASASQIGYMLEMQIDNSIDHKETVTVITRIVVDADDPAFASPSMFIGRVYTNYADRLTMRISRVRTRATATRHETRRGAARADGGRACGDLQGTAPSRLKTCFGFGAGRRGGWWRASFEAA